MKWLILCSALALSVSACMTKPPRPDQLKPAPADRMTRFQATTDGDATLVVTRDVGMTGGGCYAAVFIDGREVGKLGTGEVATFHVPAGEHIVGTWNTGAALCGYREGEDRKETSTVLRSGEIKKFRITIVPGAGVTIGATTM